MVFWDADSLLLGGGGGLILETWSECAIVLSNEALVMDSQDMRALGMLT